MEVRISPRLNSVLGYARQEAMRTGSYSITTDHFMLAILRDTDNLAVEVLTGSGISPDDLKSWLDRRLMGPRMLRPNEESLVHVAKEAQETINIAAYEALKQNQHEVSIPHLLLAISRASSSESSQYLEQHGLSTGSIFESLKAKRAFENTTRTVTPTPEMLSHIISMAAPGNKIKS